LLPPENKELQQKFNKGCKELQSEIKTEYPQILTRTSPLLLCISGGKRVPQDQEKEEELQKLNSLATE
jgi:hypothetical protein